MKIEFKIRVANKNGLFMQNLSPKLCHNEIHKPIIDQGLCFKPRSTRILLNIIACQQVHWSKKTDNLQKSDIIKNILAEFSNFVKPQHAKEKIGILEDDQKRSKAKTDHKKGWKIDKS